MSDLRTRLYFISDGFCAPGYGDLSSYELRNAFDLAVKNGWPEELIDEILDEKIRQDAEFRKSLIIGFAIAVPANDSIYVMANGYAV